MLSPSSSAGEVGTAGVDADESLGDEEFVEVNFAPFPWDDDKAIFATGADHIFPFGEDFEGVLGEEF